MSGAFLENQRLATNVALHCFRKSGCLNSVRLFTPVMQHWLGLTVLGVAGALYSKVPGRRFALLPTIQIGPCPERCTSGCAGDVVHTNSLGLLASKERFHGSIDYSELIQ